MQKSFTKLLGLATGAYATRRSLRGGPGYRGPKSDHFDGETFFNPDAGAGKSFGEFLRWQRTSRATPWPRWVENRAVPRLPATLEAGPFQSGITHRHAPAGYSRTNSGYPGY